jgi:hypothetical protein
LRPKLTQSEGSVPRPFRRVLWTAMRLLRSALADIPNF